MLSLVPIRRRVVSIGLTLATSTALAVPAFVPTSSSAVEGTPTLGPGNIVDAVYVIDADLDAEHGDLVLAFDRVQGCAATNGYSVPAFRQVSRDEIRLASWNFTDAWRSLAHRQVIDLDMHETYDWCPQGLMPTLTYANFEYHVVEDTTAPWPGDRLIHLDVWE